MGFFTKWFRRDNLPDFAQKYHSFNKQINKSNWITDTRYVCFDTETSSLDPKKAELLSIGAIVIEGDQIRVETAIEIYISRAENVKPQNVEIHGITNKKCVQVGIALEDALQQFIDYIKGAVLIAHNAAFDIAMINESLRKCGHTFTLNNPVLDTARLAIRLDKLPMENSIVKKEKYFLDALLSTYGVEPLERHTALGDAYSTAQLFLKLVLKLKGRGLKKLSDIL